jgi:hypothetical protein
MTVDTNSRIKVLNVETFHDDGTSRHSVDGPSQREMFVKKNKNNTIKKSQMMQNENSIHISCTAANGRTTNISSGSY